MAMLRAQAPHLISETPIRLATSGGWERAALLATLAMHDEIDQGPHTGARRGAGPADLGASVALTGHTFDEARFALALALSASAHGAEVRVGAMVRAVSPGDSPSVELGGGSIHARAVVLAAGGEIERLMPQVAASPVVRSLEVLLSTRVSDEAFVDARDGRRLEHVPLDERSLVRLEAADAVSRDALLAKLSEIVGPLSPSIEIHDEQRATRHGGPVRIGRAAPGIHVISGAELGSAHAAIEKLARTLAGGPPHVGDDARLEEGDFEVTPAIERTRLGADVLRAIAARHGERAAAIAERAMLAPREGAIVCPCRTVTEAELRHACHAELARDLFALSRRCELGVGACQGARCARRASAILSESTASDSASFERDASAAETFLKWRSDRSRIDVERVGAANELAAGLDVAAGRPRSGR